MARPISTDPLAGTDRLLVDGTNLLHALRRGDGAAPPATLIGRLRGVVPPTVGIELVLDGPPEPGMHGVRVASGLIVRYGGRWSADQVLMSLVDEAAKVAGGRGGDRRAAIDNILVVTDDRDLRASLQQRGARTAGTRWLAGRLDRGRLESPSTGNRRAPTPPGGSGETGDDGEDERPRWAPGRGATTKRGNPKRGQPSGRRR